MCLALDSSPQQTVFPWQHEPCPPPWRRGVLKCMAQGENQVMAPTARQMGLHVTTVQNIVQKSCHLPTSATKNEITNIGVCLMGVSGLEKHTHGNTPNHHAARYLFLGQWFQEWSHSGQSLSHAVTTEVQFNHMVGALQELGRTGVHHLRQENQNQLTATPKKHF